MRAAGRLVIFSLLWTCSLLGVGHAAEPLAMVPLRDTFPQGSITTVERADQALAAVDARKQLVEAEYLEGERACYKKFFANDCIDELKAKRRLEDADIGSVQLEASRFKRATKDKEARDKKAQQAADKAANAAKDAAQREQNRLAFEDRQAKAAQKATDKNTRSGQDAGNAAAFSAKQLSSAQNQKSRAEKHAAADAKSDQAEANQKKKEADAESRRQSLARHRDEKAADRAKRAADAKANGKPPPPGTMAPPSSPDGAATGSAPVVAPAPAANSSAK
jgi:hypothetical protein